MVCLGKYIRQETMLNLKENFTLPTYQEGFTEIIFLNQQYGFMGMSLKHPPLTFFFVDHMLPPLSWSRPPPSNCHA